MREKESFNEDASIKFTKNNFADNVITTQANVSKKNSSGFKTNFNQANQTKQKFELNDFNAFLEKLSNYENKKNMKK
jgi:hypothetical protein